MIKIYLKTERIRNKVGKIESHINRHQKNNKAKTEIELCLKLIPSLPWPTWTPGHPFAIKGRQHEAVFSLIQMSLIFLFILDKFAILAVGPPLHLNKLQFTFPCGDAFIIFFCSV